MLLPTSFILRIYKNGKYRLMRQMLVSRGWVNIINFPAKDSLYTRAAISSAVMFDASMALLANWVPSELLERMVLVKFV